MVPVSAPAPNLSHSFQAEEGFLECPLEGLEQNGGSGCILTGSRGVAGRAVRGHWSGLHRVMTGAAGVARQDGSSPRSQGKEGSFISSDPFPRRPSCPGTLTPSNEEEEPLAQVLRGVRHDDGSVQVAALHKHPEEVGDHEVVKDGGDAAAPDLRVGRGGESCWDSRVGPTERQGTSHFGAHRQGSK